VATATTAVAVYPAIRLRLTTTVPLETSGRVSVPSSRSIAGTRSTSSTRPTTASGDERRSADRAGHRQRLDLRSRLLAFRVNRTPCWRRSIIGSASRSSLVSTCPPPFGEPAARELSGGLTYFGRLRVYSCASTSTSILFLRIDPQTQRGPLLAGQGIAGLHQRRERVTARTISSTHQAKRGNRSTVAKIRRPTS